MKLIGFLLVLFVGMSGLTYGQNINKLSKKFYKAVDKNNLEEVVVQGNKILQIFRKNNRELSPSDMEYRLYIGYSLNQLGRINECMTFELETIDLLKDKTDSIFRKQYVEALSSIAIVYSNKKLYKQSIYYSKLALEVMEKDSLMDEVEYATQLQDIGYDYYFVGEYKEALDFQLRALRAFKDIIGANTPGYAMTANEIADTYIAMEDSTNASDYYGLSITKMNILLNQYDLYPNERVKLLRLLAKDYFYLEDFDKAISSMLSLIELAEQNIGFFNFNLASDYFGIASLYSQVGEHQTALNYNLKASSILANSEYSDRNMLVFSDIAENYFSLDSYDLALGYFLKALAICEDLYGSKSIETANLLTRISIVYPWLDDYENSLICTLRSMDIYERLEGRDSRMYIQTVSLLPRLYMNLNNYSKSLEYHLMDLATLKPMENPYDYIGRLFEVYGFYYDWGEYDKALTYALKTQTYIDSFTDVDFETQVRCLNQLSVAYSNIEDYKNALTTGLKLLELCESNENVSEYDLFGSYSLVYDAYEGLHQYDQALKYAKKSLDIAKEGFFGGNTAYYYSLSRLGGIYSASGKHDKALKVDLEALSLCERLRGVKDPAYGNQLERVSIDYSILGDYKNAFDYAVKSTLMELDDLRENRFGLNKKYTMKFKESFDGGFHILANAFVNYRGSSQLLFDIWVTSNGMLNSDVVLLQQNILHSNNIELKKLSEEYKLSKVQLNKYNELGIEQRNLISDQMEDLENKVNQLELKLSKKSIAFNDLQREIGRSKIMDVINEHEVYIDVLAFPELNLDSLRWKDSSLYLIFIVDSKDTLVDYVLIEDGSFLDEDVYDAYKHGVTQAKSELKNANFYNRLWKPIADKIGDAKKVYISLGGVYNKINLNTIYNPNTGKYLMEELDIQIVNSARDFVLMKEKKKKKYKSNVAALFGYPDFDSNQKEEQTEEEFAYSRDLAAFWIDSLNRGGHRASPLPGTKTEIETIEATMSKNNWEVRSFMQEQASESNFKKQHSPRVLHVATHGYFFKDIPMEKDQMRFMGMDRERVVQDPMLRSGLLLAGANKALAGAESEGENGLLSASEASLLDLSETELVVLSACETGRGEIKNSEGVYGLRKAFSNAGAENTIMSLWKVDDKVTQEFMTTFYTYWLEDKMPIREAFKSTRSFIKSKYPQPYYWGAFILVGR